MVRHRRAQPPSSIDDRRQDHEIYTASIPHLEHDGLPGLPYAYCRAVNCKQREYKMNQHKVRQAWDDIAASYDEFVTPTHLPVSAHALRLAGLQPGMRLLDVAAGSGALSITVARWGAEVLAMGISPVMADQKADAQDALDRMLDERAGRDGPATAGNLTHIVVGASREMKR